MRARLPVAAFCLAIALIVATRLLRTPMDAYGDSAAQYIEHLARLRVVLRIEQGVDPSPLAALVQLDGLYPPGLHLFTAGLGRFIGHRAEVVVWTGLLWWGALVIAVGACARSLRPGAGAWAMAATAAIPALHASATRYYYDLPMTTLIWAALAVLLGAPSGRPLLRGAGAGALLTAACLVKWSALPLGLPLLAGALAVLVRVDRTAAVRSGATLAVVTGLALGAFIVAGSTSFGAMSGATFQPPPGMDAARFAWLLSLPGGSVLRAMVLQVVSLGASRASFYPTRLIATVLSPTLALALAPLTASWLRDRASGWPLLLIGTTGTAGFLLLLVPPLDDRFLLTLAPALGLVAALGAAALPRPAALGAALLGGTLALGVAADLHLRAPTTPLHRTAGQLRPDDLDGRQVVWQAGAGSSWDLRGWSRSDTARRDRTPLRRAVDAALSRCRPATLEARQPGTVTAFGEDNWFAYREALAAVEGRSSGPTWPRSAEPAVATLRLHAHPQDALGAPVQDLPPHTWLVVDPEGGPGILMSSTTPALCPAP